VSEGKVRMGYEGREQARQATVGDDLWQLHAAGAKIAEFTSGCSSPEFAAHEVLRAAVERMLVLMAEAYTRLHQSDADLAAKFPNGTQLAALANRLDTSDGAVPPDEVWAFLEDSLPGLIAQAQDELERWHQG
jgi:uncharacterized protein with HEPN domain